jgi:hypothetical protein
MAAKKNVAVETAKEHKFIKDQLVNAKVFRENRDLVSALLEDGKEYAISEVQNMVTEYLNRKVK